MYKRRNQITARDKGLPSDEMFFPGGGGKWSVLPILTFAISLKSSIERLL